MSDQKQLTMDEFKAELGNMIDQKMRDAGMDKVDREHGVFGTKEDPNGDSLKDLSKEERVAKFLTAVVFDDRTTAKALSEGTPADGGYLVPNEFRAQVITKRNKESVIRPRATTIPMSRDKMDMPKQGNNVAVSWTAENAAFTESNPTFGTLQLDTNKLTGLSYMSRELFADSAINLLDYVAAIWGKAFAAEEDRVFMVGDGTGKPKGIHTETFSQTAAASTNLSADNLIDAFYGLPVQYRKNAVWIMHNTRIALTRKLKDTTNNYLWADGLDSAGPTILGRPVIEQNDLPTNLGAGTNESVIYFGDLSYYLIGDREEMGVETSTVAGTAFTNHQVAFKAWERLDGKLGLTDAFFKLTAVK